jgi:uncharacterized protein (UPF0264 family)
MSKLLISVRSAAEARVACACGADLIDVKEPARGALGAADRVTIDEVLGEVSGRRPVSVALGELPAAAVLEKSFADRVRYAKFGLAGCRSLPDWVKRWELAIASLPERVTPVAVVYADWQIADAPGPAEVVAHAARLGCGAVLVDTFEKSRGTLLAHLGIRDLGRFIARLRSAGLVSVVAGGLRYADVGHVAALEPDYVGVRGAACVGDRTGALDGRLVRQLADAVHQRSPMDETGAAACVAARATGALRD